VTALRRKVYEARLLDEVDGVMRGAFWRIRDEYR